jgi:hypothetical protein
MCNLRVLPILFAFNRTAYIAETYSLITAICDLNLEVLRKSHSLLDSAALTCSEQEII